MMAALTCDVCGSTSLTMTDDGQFSVCDYCGTKHTLERIRAKVQEIKGVVEVTKGEAEKERLLNNAETFIKLNENQKAIQIYKQLTTDYPDEPRGWLGIAERTYSHIISIINATPAGKTSEVIEDIFIASSVDCESFSWLLKDLFSISEKIRYLDVSIYKNIEFFEDTIISTYANKQFNAINPISSTILNHYAQVCTWSVKMQKWAADLEASIIYAYRCQKLPVLNPISESVFKNYSLVKNCSPQIQEWAKQLVNDYILSYKVGTETTLLWHYVNLSQLELDSNQNNIYPAVAEFCLLGQILAKKVNALSYPLRKRLLKSWGVDNVERLLTSSDSLYFILGYNVCIYSGYGEYSSVVKINRCITENNIEAEIRNGTPADLSKICESCGGTFSHVGFCLDCGTSTPSKQAILCENLKSMLDRSFDKQSLFDELKCVVGRKGGYSYAPSKNPNYIRTYFFSKVTPTYIELSYKDTSKSLDITGMGRGSGSFGSLSLTKTTDFKDIYLFMLKRAGKCQHCGSSFKGFFNKVCSKCGTPKDY